nr:hypothetical protein [Tanacetum cinerariifolium]
MGSKEEAERYKRKGIRFDQESSKKLKSLKEVIKEAKSIDEIPKEKIKEMMQLIPIEESASSDYQRQRDIHASREGLSSEEGSSHCNDLLQASSGELFTDGK